MYLGHLITRLFQLELKVSGVFWHVPWQEVAENTSEGLACISLILQSHDQHGQTAQAGRRQVFSGPQ